MEDRDITIPKGDIQNLKKKEGEESANDGDGAKADGDDQEAGEDGPADGEKAEQKTLAQKVDEALLAEMCSFSNSTAFSNLK